MLRSQVTQVTLAVALACVSVAFSVACASNSSPPAPSSSSSSPSTSTSEAVDTRDEEQEEQAVIDAYLAGIDAFYLAANPPDPEHPDVGATHTGELLVAVQELLSDLLTRGSAIRRSDASVNRPSVISIEDGQAIIEDCAFDADVEFDTDSLEVIDDAETYVRHVARMERHGDQWLTAAIEVETLEEPCGALAG